MGHEGCTSATSPDYTVGFTWLRAGREIRLKQSVDEIKAGAISTEVEHAYQGTRVGNALRSLAAQKS